MTESKDYHPHIVSLRTYLAVGAALLGLTAVTVAVSFVPLGGWNVVVALTVAAIKALLVAFFFMHLLYDKKIYLVIFSSGIIFLAILIILTMFDTLERGRINPAEAGPIKGDAVIYERSGADTASFRRGADSLGTQPEAGH